jgi:hypothetical protein
MINNDLIQNLFSPTYLGDFREKIYPVVGAGLAERLTVLPIKQWQNLPLQVFYLLEIALAVDYVTLLALARSPAPVLEHLG